jgi:succinate dehydrogenase (ubiquinone) cytochrome b560 subunit
VTSANPSLFKRSSKLSSPLAIATLNHSQTRPAATTSVPESEENSILAGQRRNRPISPHLSIYQPQIPWILSILNRITGATLSGSFYLFGAAYLVAPLLGWHLESASIAAAFASWPVAAKIGTKAFFALPFTFHSFNGLRHIIWDMGSQFSNKQVIVTGWTVVGLSVASALGLTFLV